MLKKKNHVGRPSNEEKLWKGRRIMVISSLPIFMVAFVGILFSSGSLSNLSGNSVTKYYCKDSSYTLKDDKCIKVLKEEYSLLGDFNLDRVITIDDYELLSNYINLNSNENQLSSVSKLQLLVGDINGDNNVSNDDLEILYDYLNSNKNPEYDAYFSKIGVQKICEDGYKLKNDHCEKIDTVSAIKK